MTGSLIVNRGKYYVSLNLVDEAGNRKQKLDSVDTSYRACNVAQWNNERMRTAAKNESVFFA